VARQRRRRTKRRAVARKRDRGQCPDTRRRPINENERWNYFNYLRIEEYFWKNAGASAGIAARLGDHGGMQKAECRSKRL